MGSAEAEKSVQPRQERPELRPRQSAAYDDGPEGVADEADLCRRHGRVLDVMQNLVHQPVRHRVEVRERVPLEYSIFIFIFRNWVQHC